MKIYYFTRKKIAGVMAIILVLLCFLGFSLFCLRDLTVLSPVNEAIYQGNSGQKAIAITVNVDWGEEFIPSMLKEFKSHKATVTFFVTGIWAEKNPELLKEMKAAGHSIQNHGYKHLHFNNISAQQAGQEIKKAEDVIFKITEEKTRFFAPPYGEHNRQLVQVVSEMNYDLIMWSVDTIDWQRPDPQTIVKRVINKVHNDAIILMHPTEPTAKALPEMLDNLEQQGYKMVAIEQIIKKDEGKKAANVKSK